MSVIVIVPLYKPDISADERISLAFLEKHLGRHNICAMTPRGLSVDHPRFERVLFDDKHFADRDAYSRLLLSKTFYKTFEKYDYMLIYQLDCLVFSDQLDDWCAKGYDYIGAPLFNVKTDPDSGFSRVGNGGLSLRKVRAFLDVLDSPPPSWKRFISTRIPDLNSAKATQFRSTISKRLRVFRDARRGVEWYTRNYTLNEDLFWSDRALLFKPDFNIAPVEEALRFAFEAHPRRCFERNNHGLPFGAHAWATWDREFWREQMNAL